MSGNLRLEEKASICALVALLRVTECPEIRDAEWIDGVVPGNGLPEARAAPFLIEHFTIDSTPDQRKLGAQFAKLVGGLEQEFQDLPFALIIAMPEDVAQKGSDWTAQRLALSTWIRDLAPSLADGHHVDVRVAGFDIDLNVWKNRGRLKPGLMFKRWTADGERGLVDRLLRAVPRKAEKLASHKEEGERSLLLLESNDIALMSAHEFLKAFRSAFPGGVSGVDDVWFCHTLTDRQADFLNAGTGDLYLFDRVGGVVEGQTWITV